MSGRPLPVALAARQPALTFVAASGPLFVTVRLNVADPGLTMLAGRASAAARSAGSPGGTVAAGWVAGCGAGAVVDAVVAAAAGAAAGAAGGAGFVGAAAVGSAFVTVCVGES